MSNPYFSPFTSLPVCGCFYHQRQSIGSQQYLPLMGTHIHATILSTASRTKLRQTFFNGSSQQLRDVQYQFPLYDGVSVVSFKCRIGGETITGVVKEKNEARAQYNNAVSRGEKASLLEQSAQASDVFSFHIGNVPAHQRAEIQIDYVGELKHDAELDGVRFTIPAIIAPRYGFDPQQWQSIVAKRGRIEMVVDVEVEGGAHLEGLASPSHPIQTTLGRTSIRKETFESNLASAKLNIGTGHLEKDFVIVINSKDFDTPRAMLEDHPSIPRHRALMTTFVPKFNLPLNHPEIVFIVDRSGSMDDKMLTVIESLKIFLKSLPLSAKFNICSFGSTHSFLFHKSQPYDEQNLKHALNQIAQFGTDYGGTELLRPIQDTVARRLPGVSLEIMVLTDGQIWNQQELFDFVNAAAAKDVRLFALGIGTGASTSLVEGLARAGNGLAQFDSTGDKTDKRVVRMLKAALSPHLTDCYLEVKYAEDARDERLASSDEDYELVVAAGGPSEKSTTGDTTSTASISLVDPNFVETPTNQSAGRYDHLPKIEPPRELQAPFKIPGFFSFDRASMYLLLPNSTREIESVRFCATSNGSPLHLEIPIQKVGVGQTIHQLAAKKAMLDTEEGRGWLSAAMSAEGSFLKNKYEADWARIVEKEAVRLGLQFQLAGKYCSFLALGRNDAEQDPVRPVPDFDSTIRCRIAPAAAMLQRRQVQRVYECIEQEDFDEENQFGEAAGACAFRSTGSSGPTTPFGSDPSQFMNRVQAYFNPNHELKQPSPSNLTPLQTIIDRQQWHGNWTTKDPTVLSTINMTQEKFDSVTFFSDTTTTTTTAATTITVNDDVKVTLMVLAWLEDHQSHYREVWEMIADKAKKFVLDSGIVTREVDVDVLIRRAIEKLS